MLTWIVLVIGNVTLAKAKRQHAKKQFPHPPYVNDTNIPNVHIQMFKAII